MKDIVLCLTLAAGLALGQEPSEEAQQRALHTVTEFARGYTGRIPDFTCVRTTEHTLAPSATKRWRRQAKTSYELSYFGHDEHYKLLAVDDVPSTKVPAKSKAGGWIEMNGNFAGILKQLFDPKVHPHFQWHGWDSVEGKRAMVFSFRIALAESQAVSSTCSSFLVFNTCKERIYGFHGQLFLDEASLDILRIENVPDDLPASYLQGKSSVDYGRVTVAGSEYLLPVADQIEIPFGKVVFRNDSTYGEYRKFVADAALKTDVP